MTTHSQSRPQAGARGRAEYSERQHAPWWWWIIAAGLGLTVLVAVWAYLGWGWGIGLTAAVMALCGAFITDQSLRVRIGDAGLSAGRNTIEWEWISRATALDAAQTRSRLSTAAHHDDFVAVRPYTQGSVVVTLCDPADPHPAWVVACKDPAAVARMINEKVAHHEQ